MASLVKARVPPSEVADGWGVVGAGSVVSTRG